MTPFPLPADPHFRKEIVKAWLDDIDDRLQMGDYKGAEESWRTATSILLSLPPGAGSPPLEQDLALQRVKLDNTTSRTTHENR